MIIALVSDVFHQPDGEARLLDRLQHARAMGAELAVLPELPMNSWSPATRCSNDGDAEAPNGPRAQIQSRAARHAEIGLIGGVIVRDPNTGVRHNTALIFDSSGNLLDSFAKIHVPEEPGFWETSHYGYGNQVARVCRAFALPLGVQICSDINRPEGSHMLAAAGAELILAPRATELITYDRWRIVFQANALTSSAWILSVNRPVAEQGVLIGGPSVAVAPDGRIALETVDPVAVIRVDRAAVAKARIDYPGYLPVRADLYAREWARIAHAQSQ
jgi:predicted amidohydrolase